MIYYRLKRRLNVTVICIGTHCVLLTLFSASQLEKMVGCLSLYLLLIILPISERVPCLRGLLWWIVMSHI